ncbi:MAG: hypothetical protein QOJ80_4651 [Mycobacterium sp.]|nr:hypothetical protein [Mycobacterium sp.]
MWCDTTSPSRRSAGTQRPYGHYSSGLTRRARQTQPDARNLQTCLRFPQPRRIARWTRRYRRDDLPHLSRIYLHCNEFHDAVSKARGVPVDGKGRFRQRACGGVLLDAGTRGRVPAPFHHQSPGAPGRGGAVAWCQDFYNTRRRHSSAIIVDSLIWAHNISGCHDRRPRQRDRGRQKWPDPHRRSGLVLGW